MRQLSSADQDVAQQLQAALDAARRLTERIERHRKGISALSTDVARARRIDQDPQAVNPQHTSTEQAILDCHLKLAGVSSVRILETASPRSPQGSAFSHPQHPPDTLPQQDADSLAPASPDTIARRTRMSNAEMETRHHELIVKQHKQQLQRKEQTHRLQIARLEAQLREQETRCREQTERADALAHQLLIAQQMLEVLRRDQEHSAVTRVSSHGLA